MCSSGTLAEGSSIRPGLYRIPDDPIAQTVLIPAFRVAKAVRGAFGWFSAGWIHRLAPGLAEFLNRESTLIIDFTVAPALYPDERKAVERATTMTTDEAAQLIAEVFVNGRIDATELGRHALDCLSWMIATNRLRLRIAVPQPESHYHPKIWLFEDGIHRVLARGSGNATSRGLVGGVEHVDVDVSWESVSNSRVKDGVSMLDDWSKGQSAGIAEVVELPTALARKIIETAPSFPPKPKDYTNAYLLDSSRSDQFKRNAPLRGHRLRIPDGIEWKTGPYAHQGQAVHAWEEGNSPERGVVSMVTAGGKTITALICASRAQDRLRGKRFLVVISAPSIPLIIQWCNEARKFGVIPVSPSIDGDADNVLTKLFRGLQRGGTHVLVVTNNLLCTPSFQSTLREKVETEERIATMLISDESHTLGSISFIQNKPDFIERRLALSATPVRQYDPDGTEQIFSFFGPTVYEFGMESAIGFCLVPYNYYVHACTLDGQELERFEELSKRIGALMGAEEEHDDEKLRSLLLARRRIIETAASKINLLKAVLERRGTRSLEHALIYASAKDPTQFEKIGVLLTQMNIKWAPVTQDTTKSTRKLESTLEAFKNGALQVVLAKKVLDEGIDIPAIREAFIVASSTIEREWIQRRGRVLRKFPNKPWAIVHDFLALPPSELFDGSVKASFSRVVSNELGRAYAFGSYAQNISGGDGVQAGLQLIRNSYWPNETTSTGTLDKASTQLVAAGTPRGKPW